MLSDNHSDQDKILSLNDAQLNPNGVEEDDYLRGFYDLNFGSRGFICIVITVP